MMIPIPDSTSDAETAAIPALPGFDLDLCALVTPEASVSLRGDDLIIGPAFGPVLTILNFVKAAVEGCLAVRLPNGVVIAADRLLAQLNGQASRPAGALA
jgi:hypothetical protein